MSELIRFLSGNIGEVQKIKGFKYADIAIKYGLCLDIINQEEWDITIQTLEKISQELEISHNNSLKIKHLDLNDPYSIKQEKLMDLLNILKDFNEEELSGIISIVNEIKELQV